MRKRNKNEHFSVKGKRNNAGATKKSEMSNFDCFFPFFLTFLLSVVLYRRHRHKVKYANAKCIINKCKLKKCWTTEYLLSVLRSICILNWVMTFTGMKLASFHFHYFNESIKLTYEELKLMAVYLFMDRKIPFIR